MTQNDLALELIRTYQRHGWNLRRVLSRPDTSIIRPDLSGEFDEGVSLQDSAIDALWFSRVSHNNREAWELRLISENPYALFEIFEADEAEDAREEVRLEMEARMREKISGTE